MLTVRSTINIASQTVPPIIPVVQGDTGRAILFSLADFTIPAGASATYYVQKPSGEAVYNNATIDGNTVLVELTAQSIIEKGDNYGQVRIAVGEDVVTSFDFILLVKEFRGIDAVESLTEMNIFDKAVEQAAEEIDDVKTGALDDIGDAKDAALQEIEQSTGNFADAFSASTTYAAGDYVIHSGQLYRFTANHAAGAWTGSDAEAVTVGEELTDLKADTNTLKEELTYYEGIFTGDVDESVQNWLDDHPEATTTIDFNIVAKCFDTVSNMVSDISLKKGDKVKTFGYYAVNDGGGTFYTISETADRSCSISLNNGLYAVLVGISHNTRQIGLKAGDNGQSIINDYISDISYYELRIVDEIHLQKAATGTDVNIVELIKIRRSNFAIIFECGGKFVLDTLNEDYYRMMALRKVSNIVIVNPVLVGDADTIGLQSGEYGHGIYMIGCQNVKVYNGHIGKCFGDAVVVTNDSDDPTSVSENIVFVGALYMYDCGRQGVSVGGCDGLYIDTIIGKNIKRAEPGAVIDYEPSYEAENRKIISTVNNIYSYDCNRAFLIADKSDKNIKVDNIFSYHSDNDYQEDIRINGCIDGTSSPKVNAYIGNVTVFDAYKTVVRLGYLNDNVSITCENITVKGMHKTRSVSADEATIVISGSGKNITLRTVNIYGNDSQYENISVYSPAGNTLDNVTINYFDDCAQRVTGQLSGVVINNTLIKQNVPNNAFYALCSSEEVYDRYKQVHLLIRSKPKCFTINNYHGSAISLYKTGYTDYTITDNQGIVTSYTSYWTIRSGLTIVIIIFDHTNKVITFKGI